MNAAEHLRNIDKRLDDLEERLNISTTFHTQRLSQRLGSWVAGNKLASAIITLLMLVVATLAIFATPMFDRHLRNADDARNQTIDSRIDAKLKPINDQLIKIDGQVTELNSKLNTLQPFIQDLVQKEMTRASAMPRPEFKKELPKITHALTAARNQNVTVQASLVNRVSNQLLGLEQHPTPEFWQAASALISYRNQPPKQVALPNCGKTTPTLSVTTPVPLTRTLQGYGEGLEYRNCTIVLDDANDIATSHLWVVEHRSMQEDWRSGKQFTLTLENVHVIYRGGTIIPADVIVFKSCTFEFDVNATPPARAQSFTQLLLASGNEKILTLGSDRSRQESSGM